MCVGTNPNPPSRLRFGRYRVITRPSATLGQHCNSATPQQLTQIARRCSSFTAPGFGPRSTTRAGRPLWSGASGTRRLWLLLNTKAVTIVTNMGRTGNGREGLCRAAGSILSMAPGRSAALKLLGGDTGDSIMLFEETAPAGTETTFHLHRDSDEVAYVLSGEITFKIGDEVTVGGPETCAFLPRGVAQPGRTPALKQGACCSCIRRLLPAAFSRNSWRGRPGRPMAPKPTKCDAGTAGKSSVRRPSSLRP